jgi:hypothetical protein
VIVSQNGPQYDNDMDRDNDLEKEIPAENEQDQVDYETSQESHDSFTTKISNIDEGQYAAKKDGKGVPEIPRRCDRLKDREDANVEEMVKDKAVANDNYGNYELFPEDNHTFDIPDIISYSTSSFSQIASCIWIILGCSVDMVERNIDIIKSLEQVRHDLMAQAEKPAIPDDDIIDELVDTG